MIKLKKGDTAWIVDSTIYVKEVEILNIKYDVATIKFKKENSGMRVRLNRLYKTKEEAEEQVKINKNRKIK